VAFLSKYNNIFDRDLLMELIQHYEYLYNLGHKDYKNQQKKKRISLA
jgi:hypothetical protein